MSRLLRILVFSLATVFILNIATLEKSEAAPVILAAPVLCAGPQLALCLVAGGLSLAAATIVANKGPGLVSMTPHRESDLGATEAGDSVTIEEDSDDFYDYRFEGLADSDGVFFDAIGHGLSIEDCVDIKRAIRKTFRLQSPGTRPRTDAYRVVEVVRSELPPELASKFTFLIGESFEEEGEIDFDLSELLIHQVGYVVKDSRFDGLIVDKNSCKPHEEDSEDHVMKKFLF